MCVSGASVSGVCYDDSKSWQIFVPSVGGLRVRSVEVLSSLVFVSFSFAKFLTTIALRPRLVVLVDNISEGNRNVAFGGKACSRYRNWNTNK